MKTTPRMMNYLLSITLFLSMLFQSPVSISAKSIEEPNGSSGSAADGQIVKKYKQVNLGNKLQIEMNAARGQSSRPAATLQPTIQSAGISSTDAGFASEDAGFASEDVDPAMLATVTILNETFESNFPTANGWYLTDKDGETNGEYLWGSTTFRFRNGARSGWEAAGGADGYDPSTNPKYPGNLQTAMIFGPFSLADATSARLDFAYYAKAGSIFYSESLVAVMASLDNNEYNGFAIGGNTSNWTTDYLDFASVDGQSLSYLGQPEVWVMFGFQTEAAAPTYEGIYLDDIVITKQTGGTPTCYSLTTSVSPGSSGSVNASPAPNCNGNQYNSGTVVTLTASANTGYTFSSWSGDAGGITNPVQVTMNANRSVTANFTQQTCYTLTTSVSPTGGGTISRNVQPNCNNNTQYTAGTQVQLTATANTGYTFGSWSGDASGTSSPVTVTMNANRTVTANFNQQCFTLTTNVAPSGGGTISRNVQPTCNNNTQYPYGTQVQLTATPNTGYDFSNWSGGATGTANPVTVTMTADRTVTANFSIECFSLTTSVNPSGGGTIGRSVQPSCNNNTQYPYGTQVQLTATANAGHTFANWSGDATGTANPVTVTMTANRTVTANFTVECFTLTTNASPSGGGTISRNVQPSCNNNTGYPYGTQVQLTANPNAGYAFTGWSGDASGTTSPVTISMTTDRTVTANFTQQCYTLTISANPSNGGSVSRNVQPNCNNNTQYTYGSQVQLTATANTGYTFTGWSGDASGTTSPVTVTMTANRNVTATFTQQCFTLTTSVNPSGGGSISRNVQPSCNNNTQYPYGTQVQLTATANAGHTFANWSGDASGTTSPVTVTMTANRNVTANFTVQCFTLATAANPSGGGTISRNVQPSCNNNTQYPYGTQVQLTANPNAGYTFSNWSGDASGTTSPVTVTMTANRSVTATFTQLCFTLSTPASPSNGGSVSRSIQPNCNNNTQYSYGTQVQLTATANTGYTFTGWSGDASGTTSPVTVTMTATRTVTANFAVQCFTLATSANPSGGGTVSRSVQPNCNNNTQYTHGTQVQLTATANTGYTFANWSGGATGTANPVTVTMTANRTVTANFNQLPCYTLTTAANPSGGGTISANPAPNCSNGTQYITGTQVQLTATANPGYTFTGWSGAVTGTTNPVTVTMTANRSVTANFTIQCFTLTTSASPTGGGSVSRSVQPNCNNNTQYTYGTQVQLTAIANTGYIFTTWSGDASGSTTPLMITMDRTRTVTANFTQLPCYTLTTSVNPSGSGTVSANPAPNCNNGTQYISGTQVHLTATANTGYSFANWSGNASGTSNPVTVTMSANRSVTANFNVACYTLTVSVSPSGGGSVSRSVQPNCNNNTQYTHGTQVQLTATANTGYNFANWSGGATGTANPVTVTMTADRTVTANFTIQCFTLTTAASPTGSGTINRSPAPNCNNNTQYSYNTQVQLTASASTGYAFSSWSGDAAGTSSPVTVAMTANRSVIANFATLNPTPTLTSVKPNVILAGAQDTILTLTGTGFINESVIRWNGNALAGVQYISSTELRVTVPAARLTTAATIQVTVFNPTPGGGTSNPISLAIVTPKMIYLPCALR